MHLVNGAFLIIIGLGAMGFGLFLFYALLPLFYAFFGVGVGFWLGALITGNPLGSTGIIELVLGLIGGVLFAGAAYFLEPFRRILLGIGLGGLVAGAIAGAFGWVGVLGVALMLVGSIVGALLTLVFFDPFIIFATAFAGASLIMDGLFIIIPQLDMLDRTQIQSGQFLPTVIWIVLAAVGLGWQFMNISKWVGIEASVE